MGVTIYGIGGYEEVGMNMTAVKVDDEVIILDMGWALDKVLSYFGEYIPEKISTKEMIKMGAFPNDSVIHEYKDKVKAIVLSHAHLDHISAAPKMAPFYKDAPVIATPYTIQVLKRLIKEEPMPFKNRLVKLSPNSSFKVSKNITIEFIYVTHSVPQSVMTAIHTKYGVILYSGDYKFDDFPVIGQKTNMKRLLQLGKQGVLCLIADSTRVDEEKKTFSESVFNAMFRDVLLTTNEENLIVATTFSSHIARLKTMVEQAIKMKRIPVIFGRSMYNYIHAAEEIGIVKISDKARIVKSRKEMEKIMRKINMLKKKYFVICSGHQGEPSSVLSKIADNQLPLDIGEEDQLIFCSMVIPTPIQIAQRLNIENKFKERKVRLFMDIHVHGHGSREDLHDLMKIVKPKHIVPCHGDISKLSSAINFALQMGYTLGKTAHLLQNGNKVDIV